MGFVREAWSFMKFCTSQISKTIDATTDKVFEVVQSAKSSIVRVHT